MVPSDTAASDITATSEWAALARHARELQAVGVDLAGLFEADPDRPGRCTSTAGELVIDWSRHLVTDATVELLLALAERAGWRRGSRRCWPASRSTSRTAGQFCTPP